MAHKVYFACSIRGGGDTSAYQYIVDAIKASKAVCLSEVLVHDAINLGGSPLPNDEIFQRDVAWIRECNAIIAEVTNPSLGVGYELAFAESIGKPVLTLFSGTSEKRLSAMINGNSYFTNQTYHSTNELSKIVSAFLSNITVQ